MDTRDGGYVVGIDGFRTRWVWVALEKGRLGDIGIADSVADIIQGHPGADVIAIDIPVGLPIEKCCRDADSAARAFVAPLGATVFTVPPAEVLEKPTYQEANAYARELCGHGISIQAYSLRHKIFQANEALTTNNRLIEVHPEVSFRALADKPLRWGKRTWNGQMQRRSLLAAAGIEFPDALDGDSGKVGVDDLLDAAVAAWSAQRVHANEAKSFPDPPELIAGREVAIRY